MFNRTNLLILVIAIVGALGGFLLGGLLRPPPPTRPGVTLLKPGQPAPQATRPGLDGKPLSLDQWRGKLVLVNFWASWCAPCREEMPMLDRMQTALGGKGLQIVGVASDDTAATQAFLAKLPVHYPILIDDPATGSDLSAEFGNGQGVLPYSVLVGRDGRVLAQRAGSFTQASLTAWLSPYL